MKIKNIFQNNFPLVSIVIPYFNDGMFVLEAINSAKKQTYPNIEIIVIDDGSTEAESIKIFDEIEIEGVYKYRESNKGPSAARNLGISHSDGKYILPLDADDKIDETYVEKAVYYMEMHDNVGIVYCKAKLFGEKNEIWDLPEYTLKQMLINNVIFVTAMFRKRDWEYVNGYDINMRFGIEDYEFWLSIIELGRDVYCIPEILFFYRIKSVSRSTKLSNNVISSTESYDYILRKHKKIYELYCLEIISELRKKNISIENEYAQFKQKIPFYKYFQNMSHTKKDRIKRFFLKK